MSFCVNGASFGPEQYYRDDDHARRVLWASRENPVLVTGLRRIGKSWFLRRFDQILKAGKTRHFGPDGNPFSKPLEAGMPAKVTVLDAGADDFEEELRAALALRDPDIVLAIDELEKLAADPSRSHLVDALLSHRPLILAAAPSIHEIARASAPKLADLFERGGCVPVILGPLLGFERRALMFQTCDMGEGLQPQQEGVALGREWGGHPLVLQQVGESLQRNPKLKFADLVDLVHAVLNGAPRYGYSLCETGLTSAQHEVLLRVAAGDPPASDDHTALELKAHGAIVPRKSKVWAVENIVLQRYCDGMPAPARRSTSIQPGPVPFKSRPSKPVRVFAWVHLSDLHFGAGTVSYRFDHKAVMRAIERDLSAHAPRPVDRIFVTGDVAFAARADDYTCARKWLEPVVKAARVGLEGIRFVPGNHDVDRDVIKKSPLLRAVHYAAREGRIELDDLLADKEARDVLAAKLAPYRSFVAGFPGHPAPSEGGVDWVERIAPVAGRHGAIRIAGLSTVWTSDELDGKDASGKGFVRNLLLAHGPLDHLVGEAMESELTFLLTHHPPEWIAPRADGVDLLSRELRRLSHIHLSGHVHDAKAGSTKRHGREGRSIFYVAGAAHSDPSEAAKHGYAWGAVRYEPAKGRWEAGWAPRVYVDGAMCADATGNNLDADGFAWEDIECRWPAPAAPA